MPEEIVQTLAAPPPEAEGRVPEPAPVGPPEERGSDVAPEPETEGEKHWLADVADEEALRGHEKVKTWLQETAEQGRNEGVQEARGQMQSRIDARNGHLKRLQESLTGFWQSFGSVTRALEKDGIDSDNIKELNDLLGRYGPTLDTIAGVHWSQGQQATFLGYATPQGIVPGVITGLFGDDKDAAEDWAQRARNLFEFETDNGNILPVAKDYFTKLRDALTASAVKQAIAEETPRIEERLRRQVKLEAEAKDKGKTPPPVEPIGGGGGGSRKSYKGMSDEEKARLTPEERDAMTQVFIRTEGG